MLRRPDSGSVHRVWPGRKEGVTLEGKGYVVVCGLVGGKQRSKFV